LSLVTTALVGCGGDPMSSSDDQFNTEGPPLAYDEYQVLFTNPECDLYEYDQEVRSENGEILTAKPKNVFCSYDDGYASGDRPESPQHKLLEWIDDPSTNEIFFTYLSFSSSTVLKALCSAIEERDVKVTFVLDSGTDTTKANTLLECQPSDPDRAPRFEKRGHTPGIGYAHNKLFMINPGAETMKLAFSSGNMSSGVVLHHENWHFIEPARDSFFAQAHVCLMEGQLSETASASKTAYRAFMNDCRKKIDAEPEADIGSFFVPNKDDSGQLFGLLAEGLETAATVDIGAHRFALTNMIDGLAERMKADKDFKARLVVDDDLYWLDPLTGAPGEQVGSNLFFERDNIDELVDVGGGQFEVKYMETNHTFSLLHHNKFLIFHDMPERPDSVLCGAANLTGTGFRDNFENVYWVEIPSVVQAFERQYDRFWDGKKASADEDEPPRATAPEDMPVDNVQP
jgi:hypothetical protein